MLLLLFELFLRRSLRGFRRGCNLQFRKFPLLAVIKIWKSGWWLPYVRKEIIKILSTSKLPCISLSDVENHGAVHTSSGRAMM